MVYDYDLPNNTKVRYDNGIFKGEGIIVGISTTSLPVIGKTYMVKDLSGNVPNEKYQYEVFSCIEVQLEII